MVKGRALRGPGWLEQARERRAAEPASTFKQSPRRSSRGVGDIPDTASSPRRHRYRGAHASQPLSQPPACYRPLDLNFSTLQCSTVLLYDLGTLYTVQLYTVLDQATV